MAKLCEKLHFKAIVFFIRAVILLLLYVSHNSRAVCEMDDCGVVVALGDFLVLVLAVGEVR